MGGEREREQEGIGCGTDFDGRRLEERRCTEVFFRLFEGESYAGLVVRVGW